jgi:hypothetical protein
LLDLFFDPDDGDDIFLRNVDWFLRDYMALHPRKYFITTILSTSNITIACLLSHVTFMKNGYYKQVLKPYTLYFVLMQAVMTGL